MNCLRVLLFCSVQLVTSSLSIYNYVKYVRREAENPQWRESFSPAEIALQNAYIVVLVGPTVTFVLQICTIKYLLNVSNSVTLITNCILLHCNTVNIFGIHHIRSNDIRRKSGDDTCCFCAKPYHWPYVVVSLSIVEIVYSTWFIFNQANQASDWHAGLILKLILSGFILLNYMRAIYLLIKHNQWRTAVLPDWVNAEFLGNILKSMDWSRDTSVFDCLNRELQQSKSAPNTYS